jgi:ADP-heptose:LPS heptosyltransferase
LDYKRILVFRTGHLGDTLVSLPAFWGIKKSFPEAHLTLLTNTNPNNPQYVLAQSVLPQNGLFDNWMNYPTGLGKYQTIQMFIKLFLEIRRGKFDVLIYLMNRNRTLKQIDRDERFFKMAGIRNFFGINYLKKNLLSFEIDKPLPVVKSEMEFFLTSLSNEGHPLSNFASLKPEMLLTIEEKGKAENWLKENAGINFQEKKIIGVAPGSKWDSKIWSEDKFFRVVEKLIEKEKVFPVVFGGSEDRNKGNRLLEKWNVGANAAGELKIREAAAALENCRLYIGNDTGTMHLAASVGTKCVCIFAAIDFSGRWFPFGEGHKIFRKQVECEGCHTPLCFNQRKCLELIETEEVYRACVEILGNERTEKTKNLNF